MSVVSGSLATSRTPKPHPTALHRTWSFVEWSHQWHLHVTRIPSGIQDNTRVACVTPVPDIASLFIKYVLITLIQWSRIHNEVAEKQTKIAYTTVHSH